MNTSRIVHAAREVERLSSALKWLLEYGHQLNHREAGSFAIRLTINSAGACPGSKEATDQLEGQIRLHIQDRVLSAIKDAENTIEMHRNALREECA